MGLPTVHLTLTADTRVARDLSAGGVFVHGCELAVNEHCELIVKTHAGELRIEARVVYIDGRGGAGLELVGFGATMKTQLAALVARGPEPPAPDAFDESIDTLDMEMSELAALPSLGAAGVYAEEMAGVPSGYSGYELDEPTIRRPSTASESGRLAARNKPSHAPPLMPPLPQAQAATHDDANADMLEGLRDSDNTVRDSGETLRDLGDTIRASIRSLDDVPPAESGAAAVSSDSSVRASDDNVRASDDALPASDAGASDGADANGASDVRDADVSSNGEPDDETRDSDGGLRADSGFFEAGTDEERKVARSMHERLRGLPMAEQIKKANSSDPGERIMLERIYGKTVWEALLRNSRLTAPEVARIARMGALPRPLLEVIVGNGGWLQVPEVRRALLSNPRLGADQILRVLRLMPKNELKLCATQTVYPFAVRDAAKRLVRG
jgi:hypothetical protein